MKFHIKVNSVKTIEEIENYWSNEDYIKLLELFNFPDANTIKPENLREMLFMAITDFEPNEAAATILTYKLSESLNEGQIAQISHDMLIDKVCEEYPDIGLHCDLFSVNQLLYKAYNGTFLNCKATLVNCEIEKPDDFKGEITKEIVLKSFNRGLSDSNIIKRLFEEKMTTETRFEQAEDILWKLNDEGNNTFSFITSEYWLNKDEIIGSEFDGESLLAETEA
ncbi:hypothetical protein [Chryseobacterium caseinilyticum]|uniref:DUF4240 domain-containing protein n=1 Tax=Chryseobacterium caseinilyticum TaxID=2771428 RepID=A0ABR8ZGS7_9FLAO|nr:hypothetical protein [Chryseobacterium caseinilyticum]MBD8084518.1 hypothetical protein [Chryseobacterium caseinilyticum]